MRKILQRALEGTSELWPDVETAYRWVHGVAKILKNEARRDCRGVQRRLRAFLGAMIRHRAKAGGLSEALEHFMKVSRSYWPGLFFTYEIRDLPRTNNDLEHLFGSHRYQERRVTGRKMASPALVLRGAVRIVASTATRLRTYTGPEIAPASVEAWRDLRRELEERRQRRALRFRFRRDPAAYLNALKDQLLQQTLPP